MKEEPVLNAVVMIPFHTKVVENDHIQLINVDTQFQHTCRDTALKLASGAFKSLVLEASIHI